MKRTLLCGALLTLAGCMQAANPTVSERNSAGISLQTGPGVMAPVAIASTQRTASGYCAGGGKGAVYIDTRMMANGAEHYYACR